MSPTRQFFWSSGQWEVHEILLLFLSVLLKQIYLGPFEYFSEYECSQKIKVYSIK